MSTRLEQAAAILFDREWHTSTEMVERCGHRFGAAFLELRKGEHDGEHWVIEGEPVVNGVGEWRYRLKGFATHYRPHTPTCPKCGYHLRISDARKGGEKGVYEGPVTTEKQANVIDAANAELEKSRDTIRWQADIILRTKHEVESLKAKLAVLTLKE